MIKYERTIKSMIALILVVALVFPVAAFTGKKASMQVLPEKKNLPADAILTVGFEKPVQAATITAKNIYVVDASNRKLAITRSLSKDGRVLTVKPEKSYQSGKTYTLYVKSNVRYKTGGYLAKGMKQVFSITSLTAQLPSVGSYEKLAKLLENVEQYQNYYYGYRRGGPDVLFTADVKAAPAPAAAIAKAEEGSNTAGSSPDYSTTNVQVQGVDEADLVKTDGKYIYTLAGSKVVVAEAYPAKDMKLAATIDLGGDINPTEMYLDDKYLVVVANGYNQIPVYRYETLEKCPPYYRGGTVKLLVYDITDKQNIRKTRELELEGSYLSSRKIGSKVYLVSNMYVNYYGILHRMESADNPANPSPYYKDSAAGKDFMNIGYDKIKYFPDSIEPNYMTVAAFDVASPTEKADITTYLGSGQSIYVSQQNLFVAVTKYEPIPVSIKEDKAVTNTVQAVKAVPPLKPTIMPNYDNENTLIYRFSLNEGKPKYTGSGQVPGRILNQFSMDEHKDNFRIATTKGQTWNTGENISKNNVYVLDGDLKTAGKLEDIAPGEKIYSVRFLGDRAYMVTFRTVDPLFVIDLKDAKKPQILGALKIPGYSEYIHPYDENHIIGFGKDAVEVVYKDDKGNETGRNAYYLGMKIAVFDVTDVTNPVEMWKEKIGDRGTTSELLQNHKALLFSKEKNLLAFPVTVYTVNLVDRLLAPNGPPPYGKFAFQGAYVYQLDLKEGFKLKGMITHMSDEDYKKAGDYWYDSNKNVNRILYINDTLYTLSNTAIKANGIEKLEEKGILQIMQ